MVDSVQNTNTLTFLHKGNRWNDPWYVQTVLLPKKNKLYWTIRDIKSINWFMDEFLALRGSTIEPIIYITGAPTNDNSPSFRKI